MRADSRIACALRQRQDDITEQAFPPGRGRQAMAAQHSRVELRARHLLLLHDALRPAQHGILRQFARRELRRAVDTIRYESVARVARIVDPQGLQRGALHAAGQEAFSLTARDLRRRQRDGRGRRSALHVDRAGRHLFRHPRPQGHEPRDIAARAHRIAREHAGQLHAPKPKMRQQGADDARAELLRQDMRECPAAMRDGRAQPRRDEYVSHRLCASTSLTLTPRKAAIRHLMISPGM